MKSPSSVRYGLVFLLLAISLAFVVVKRAVDRYEALDRLSIRLSDEIGRERERNKALLARLRELETDRYVELLARRRLGYVKSGESAYKVMEKAGR